MPVVTSSTKIRYNNFVTQFQIIPFLFFLNSCALFVSLEDSPYHNTALLLPSPTYQCEEIKKERKQ